MNVRWCWPASVSCDVVSKAPAISVIYIYSKVSCAMVLCGMHASVKCLLVNTHFPLCGWHLFAAAGSGVVSAGNDLLGGAGGALMGRRLQQAAAGMHVHVQQSTMTKAICD
jgi:hypothetical protein